MSTPIIDFPLDKVLWDRSTKDRRVDLAAAVGAAERVNGGHAVQVVFETVFTDAGQPFSLTGCAPART